MAVRLVQASGSPKLDSSTLKPSSWAFTVFFDFDLNSVGTTGAIFFRVESASVSQRLGLQVTSGGVVQLDKRDSAAAITTTTQFSLASGDSGKLRCAIVSDGSTAQFYYIRPGSDVAKPASFSLGTMTTAPESFTISNTHSGTSLDPTVSFYHCYLFDTNLGEPEILCQLRAGLYGPPIWRQSLLGELHFPAHNAGQNVVGTDLVTTGTPAAISDNLPTKPRWHERMAVVFAAPTVGTGNPAGAVTEERPGAPSATASPTSAGGTSGEIPGAVTAQLGGQGLPAGAPSEERGAAPTGAAAASTAGAPSTETPGAVAAMAGQVNNAVPAGKSEESTGAPAVLVLASPVSGDSEEFPGAVTAISGSTNQVSGEPSREAGGAPAAAVTSTGAGGRSEESGGAPTLTSNQSPAGAASTELGGAPSATAAGAPAGGGSGEQAGAPVSAASAATAGATSTEIGGAVTALQGFLGFPAGEPSREIGGAPSAAVASSGAGGRSDETPGAVIAGSSAQAFPAGAPSTERGGPLAASPAPAPAGSPSEERGGAVMAVVVASAGPGARSEEVPGAVVGGPLNVTYCYAAGAPSEERAGAVLSAAAVAALTAMLGNSRTRIVRI